MNHTVWEYIEKTRMIEKGDTVIVGVSGGADSVCLLLLLAEYRGRLDFSLRAVHVEHGIRGEESRRDALFVEKLCERLFVPCTVYRVNVPDYAAAHRMGTEEAARRLRYRAFGKEAARIAGLAAEIGDDGAGQEGLSGRADIDMSNDNVKIALAHHREDDAETVLFQMIRGSGIAGLCGMRPIRRMEEGYTCIRPLLYVSRKDIEDYLEQCGQEYCEDITNRDTGYSRNRLRQQVFPLLEQINPQAAPHIQHSAVQLAKIRDYLEQQAGMMEAQIVSQEGETLFLEIEPLLALHPALQEEIVRNALFRASGCGKDIAAVHIDAVMELMGRQSGKRLDLPYGVTARREYGRLAFVPRHESPQRGRESEPDGAWEGQDSYRIAADQWEGQDSYRIAADQWEGQDSYRIAADKWEEWKSDGEIHCIRLSESEKIMIRIFPFSGDIGKIPKKPCTKWLDYGMIEKGIVIRHRVPGDMLCVDAQGHHKKLKRYLIDRKIPADKRDRMWILADGFQVVWILGDRMGEDYKVSEDTSHIVEITYIGTASAGQQ